jgi:hypothetical protein
VNAYLSSYRLQLEPILVGLTALMASPFIHFKSSLFNLREEVLPLKYCREAGVAVHQSPAFHRQASQPLREHLGQHAFL